jgi:hypothetical protein
MGASILSDLNHFTGEFVPHDRIRYQIAPTRGGIDTLRPMQIGATDSTRLDLKDQIIWARFGINHFFDHQWGTRLLENCCLHCHL